MAIPDVLNWEVAEFVLGPNLTITERKDHPCLEKDNQEFNLFVSSVKTSMEPQRMTLRLCNALGGIMNSPQNEFELKALGTKLIKFTPNCPSSYVWVPIFKGASDEKWLDANGQAVNYTRWRRGQPNGGNDNEKCTGIGGIGTDEIGYFDTMCASRFCF